MNEAICTLKSAPAAAVRQLPQIAKRQSDSLLLYGGNIQSLRISLHSMRQGVVLFEGDAYYLIVDYI